ncbi:MAG: hypothetical protein HY561_06290 [Gemmatimonadetes bacterium]|nr:hypothetical protein [Gemmatimonadota bacterium]
MKKFRTTAAVAVLAIGLAAPPPVRAQLRDTAAARRLAEQRLGHPVAQTELIERLRPSGMSRAEVRARLRQMGVDH